MYKLLILAYLINQDPIFTQQTFQMHLWMHLQQIDRPAPDSLEDLLDPEQVDETASCGQLLGLVQDLLLQALQG